MPKTKQRGHGGILVVDPDGRIFSALRSLDLDVPLWCVADATRVSRVEEMDVAVHAAYETIDWHAALGVAARVRTMVVAETAAAADALRSLSNGLIGYVGVDAGPDALRGAVQGAMRGEAAYSPEIVGEWLELQRGRRASGEPQGLTPRQLEVLALIARGAADKEIATTLGISTATAQKHVTNILERLKVPNRAAAVAAAFSPAASWLRAAG